MAAFGHGIKGAPDGTRERGRDVGTDGAKARTGGGRVRGADIVESLPLNRI
jgi:hypothetical protein